MSYIFGTLSILGYVINTLFWCIPLFILAILKLIPIDAWRTLISHPLDGCATAWIGVNGLNQALFSRTQIHTSGIDDLKPDDWYLIISNHQSWVDILVLQRIFNRKIPFIKFFLKKELIWVPVIGLAWWALDFPFMRRSSKAELAKKPELKGKDIETTRKACEKFKYKPVSIMNFVEGTRWTEEKYCRQSPPFKHLLKPKAGGMAFVLNAMGDQLNLLLNVSIYYPGGIPTFWDFVSGKVERIDVDVQTTAISDLLYSEHFAEDYPNNPEQRAKFQRWLNTVWQNKDTTLEQMKTRTYESQ